MNTYTPTELVRFLDAAGESANIDAKGPMLWDGGEASAGLTKDILAFANSRDGGVVVIGKEEAAAGVFKLTGVSTDQADSFETTKVAAWVNNRCAPPVGLVCYRVQHDGKEFVVLTVAEFHDVPVICTKQFELPGKPAKVLLRNGTIYVRTANAESAPLSSIEDVRALIGLATTKRADQMLTMFQAMMKGRPLLAEESDEERWATQAEAVQASLQSQLGEQAKLGRWEMSFHPATFCEERWEEAAQLKMLVEKHAVRLRDEFPGVHHDYHVEEWGIGSHEYEDVFGLTRAGLFVASRVFREDTDEFRNPWQPNPNIPAGKWFDFQWNMAQVIEFFIFMSRFSHEFETGEEIEVEVAALPLRERILVSLNPRLHFFRSEAVCRSQEFRRKRTITTETLRSNWEDECARTLHRLFELFAGHRIELDTLRKWIERFKDRTFWN